MIHPLTLRSLNDPLRRPDAEESGGEVEAGDVAEDARAECVSVVGFFVVS